MGLTEEDFWRSTLAKVMALHRVKVFEWDQTRDFFVAQLTAFYIASKTEKGKGAASSDEILSARYPRLKKPKGLDPDHGAAGGADLRSGLQSLTVVKKRKKRHA